MGYLFCSYGEVQPQGEGSASVMGRRSYELPLWDRHGPETAAVPRVTGAHPTSLMVNPWGPCLY